MSDQSSLIAAPHEMQRVLEIQPSATATLRNGGVIVQRWQHAALHDHVRPMADHVFMTYNGSARRIERRGSGGVQRSVTRDDSVTLIPAGEHYGWDIYGDLNATHVYISAQRLSELALAAGLAATPELLSRTASTDVMGSQLIRALTQSDQSHDRLSSLWRDTAADMLCLHLLRNHLAEQGKTQAIRPGCLAPWQLTRVTDYIDAHLCEDVSLADLAQLVGLSSFHFCRAFKASTGLPPHRWRQRLRIERARHLLQHTELPVAEVGHAVGYEDASLFAVSFRRATGFTPSQYRRHQRA